MSDNIVKFPDPALRVCDELAAMDQEALTSFQTWLREAVEDAGAECTGSGIGFGALDLDIKLDGFRFQITMKPAPNDTSDKDETDAQR